MERTDVAIEGSKLSAQAGAEGQAKSAPSVAVVMSTYNGAAYVREQIDSILAQDYPNVHLIVRDDGSSDETIDILRNYEQQGQLTLFVEENAGIVGSFLSLVERCAPDYDYVALCDQDDVWHTDKISRAVSLLSARSDAIPQLYCAEYVYCDQNMQEQGRSHLNRIGVRFETLLYENMVSGNTCVMNKTLARLVGSTGTEGVYCHDWWIALLACSFGELTFDDFACLDYRRTESNASPSGSHGLRLLRYRIKVFFQQGQLAKITGQLEQLHKLFATDLKPDHRKLLEHFLRDGRPSKMVTPVRLRQMARDEIALRVLFLLGLL